MARLVVFALAAALVAVPGARADGDPASDTLITENVFLPYPAPSKERSAALAKEVAVAYARGYRLKVAVIATATDLGAIPSLFGKPDDYAKFLGEELRLFYVGPLLIVMPAGYGIYDGGRSTAAERRVLARASIHGGSPDELTRSAADTVHKLVAAKALRSKDVKAPYVGALTGSGRRGKPALLRYVLFDDSGRARLSARVRGTSKRTLKTFATPLRAVRANKTYSLTWQVPKTLRPGTLSFCVIGIDPSGNRSKESCAALRVQ